jgi:hypothetical protein
VQGTPPIQKKRPERSESEWRSLGGVQGTPPIQKKRPERSESE